MAEGHPGSGWQSGAVAVLIGVVIALTIGVVLYVQLAVKRVESELPLRVMQERRDMEQVARNFYEFLASTDAALVRPTAGGLDAVRDGLRAVERNLDTLRTRYTFDTLIGASALHAVLSPIVDDVNIWLNEGFGAVPASSPIVLEVVATRARDALSKVYDKTTEADRLAYDILERQSAELRDLRERLLLVVVAFTLLAAAFVWIVLTQGRTARARQLAELAQLDAQARLQDALESTTEGFAFFDSGERLVMCNSHYKEVFLTGVSDLVTPGRPFAAIMHGAVERGLVATGAASAEVWLEQRLERFRAPSEAFLSQLSDGRWLQVNERKTSDGGTVAVYSDVTELIRREHELMAARDEAQAANEAKSAFLANVSHELRTPLTSILGFTAIVQRRLRAVIFPTLTDPAPRVARAMRQVTDNIDIILVEGERLTTLINNVLDLERIEAGEMAWNLAPLEIAEVVRRATEATRSLFEAGPLRLEVDVSEELPPVMGDRDKVMQVLVNFLSNAVKFTPEGSVACRAERAANDAVRVTVTDTGVGIDEAEQARVFEKFRQVGDTLTDKPSGTGLGLAICKEIVEHLGGTIGVQSAPGRGSTFEFTLPVADMAANRWC